MKIEIFNEGPGLDDILGIPKARATFLVGLARNAGPVGKDLKELIEVCDTIEEVVFVAEMHAAALLLYSAMLPTNPLED